MVTQPPTALWTTFGASVQGANKQENQDFWAAEGTGGAADPLILVVADGHGAAAHARSRFGARFAVDLLTGHAKQFARLDQAPGAERPPSLSWLMNHAEDVLPRQFVADWRARVLQHWDRHPSEREGGAEPSEAQKLLLYGTTVVGAVLTPRVLAAWQLGDGELTVVAHDGSVSLPLAPERPRLGDESESLCARHAWRLVRVLWAPVSDPRRTPVLLAASTDGLSHSFSSDAGFVEFMSGLHERLAAPGGPDEVREALPEWLAKASGFSGDDATLAAAVQTSPTPAAEAGRDSPAVPADTAGTSPAPPTDIAGGPAEHQENR